MGLLHDVEKAGFAVAETEAGIYDMSGLIFPVRLVVTAEIDPDENLWLAMMTLREIMAPEIDKEIAQARLEASTEAAATYMRKGMLEGHLEGMREGMREGRSEAERSIAENLVASGLLTLEQIAAATGLSLEEVRQIAAA